MYVKGKLPDQATHCDWMEKTVIEQGCSEFGDVAVKLRACSHVYNGVVSTGGVCCDVCYAPSTGHVTVYDETLSRRRQRRECVDGLSDSTPGHRRTTTRLAGTATDAESRATDTAGNSERDRGSARQTVDKTRRDFGETRPKYVYNLATPNIIPW